MCAVNAATGYERGLHIHTAAAWSRAHLRGNLEGSAASCPAGSLSCPFPADLKEEYEKWVGETAKP